MEYLVVLTTIDPNLWSQHLPGTRDIQVNSLKIRETENRNPTSFSKAFSMCCIFFIGFRLLSVYILWRKSRFVL